MAFQHPLRSRCAVLGTSLAVCGGAIGCNVYDDELLRRPNDASHTANDSAGAADGATNDSAPPLDDVGYDAADATLFDATSTDATPGRDTGPTSDAFAPDASGDREPPSADADAASVDGSVDGSGTRDARDAPFEATTGSDADAGGARPDASDAAPADASGGADADARDGTSIPPDVTTDGAVPPPTFRVVRVGEGSTGLSAASTAVFIEERRWDGQVVGQPLSLPTSGSGGQHPLTLSGIATSEGALALSLDGRYLTLAGYATGSGSTNVATSTDVERVVARVDAAGLIDTTTLLGDAYSGSNVRSAASVDGAAFWAGGSSGGVWYARVGGSGRTQIAATPDNIRLVALFGDQLYGCSGASQMNGVFTVGSGRPTSGLQTVAALDGMPRSGMSPYAFALFDLDPAVAGLDTLYLTDDRSPESDGSGGGIQRWTLQGGTWSRRATFTAVEQGTASFRGLAGIATSAGVILVASTSETIANRLVMFIDDGSPTPTGRVVATASSNTIFRGVALSPHP